MRGSRNYVRGLGPGRRLENSLDNVCFSPHIILQRGSNGFIVEKTILSQGSRGVVHLFFGGPTFSRGVQLFPGGGGGPNADSYHNNW